MKKVHLRIIIKLWLINLPIPATISIGEILNVQRNKFNQALSDYNGAIRLDPKSTLAYYNRGLLRTNLGDSNNAIGDPDMRGRSRQHQL